MEGLFARCLASAILALAPLTGAWSAETVQSLRYGVSLFHLYQGDYFNSLTELMVGQTREELGVHTENAELLRGGIALSYGMDREAERVFTALLGEDREGVDRGRAWFYLGKLAWQRGDADRAAQALDQAGTISNPDLAMEAVSLRANLALRRGEIATAAELAAGLPEESDWRNYLDYNIGAALAASGQFGPAAERFGNLGETDATPELKALRDRSFTAAGYARMAAGDFDGARADFSRVRLNSPLSERALLGYGWAALEQGDYQSALSPWQALSGKPAASQSVRESLLAIPYAYQQLGRDGLALTHYQQASRQLESELVNVRAAIDQFQHGSISGVLQIAPTANDDWLFGEDMLPVSDEAPYLRQLIASHRFQAAMREWRDLQRIQQNLVASVAKLKVLAEADREQQANWRNIMEGGGREQLQARRDALAIEVEQLRDRLGKAESAGDGRDLAGPERRVQWQRVERASVLAEKMNAPESQRELLRLYRGLLIWEDSEDYPDRRWRAQRELASLEAVLAESEQRFAGLDKAIAGRRQSNFAPRIVALSDRVSVQQSQLAAALDSSETALRQVAVAELRAQERALSHSLGQSRLAVARLYDRSSTGPGVSP